MAAFFFLSMMLVAYQTGVLLERSDVTTQRDLLAHAQGRADDAHQLRITQARLLAKEMGTIQARIMRLEVLGQRLAESQGLDQEFDFSSLPGVGGSSALSFRPAIEFDEPAAAVHTLSPHLERLEIQLAMIGDFTKRQEFKIGMMPHGWPVTRGWISSYFGLRNSPFTGRREMHEGIDIAGREGTPIQAVAGGVVRLTRQSADYGNLIELDHGNGYVTRYAHNKENLAAEGELVKKGDVIATMGSTGHSTGSHLHFEVLKNGQPIDPRTYLTIKP